MNAWEMTFAALGEMLGRYDIRREAMKVRFTLSTIRDLAVFEKAIKLETSPLTLATSGYPESMHGIEFEAVTSQRIAYPDMGRDRAGRIAEAKADIKKARDFVQRKGSRGEYAEHVRNLAFNIERLLEVFDDPGIPPGTITRDMP